jgi:TatD DNase family protein
VIDTHCHLSDPKFDGDRADALSRAWQAGLSAVVEIADAEPMWAPARALAEAHPGRVWWAPGFHPYVADKFDEGLPSRVREALSHPQAVALGEIGLDYFKHCAVPRDRQKDVFSALAAAGFSAGKPLILHCRESDAASTDAQEDMLSILRGLLPPSGGGGSVRGVAHCFQGTIDNARRFIDLGFMIGIDAPVTYPKAESLREMVRALPLSSLVLETDSPYLPPQERRGQRNEPSFLPAVADAVARAKGVPPADVVRLSTVNARRLYGFPS